MEGGIRVSAKTVDDAINEALIQLGVTSDNLEYDVIEKGSAGFFGIGMKQAVIEARRKKRIVEEEEDFKIDLSISLDKPEKKERKEKKKDFKKELKKEEKKAKKEEKADAPAK
ncbi:MAG: Jag N-terminal domain-containing protein, partial [Schaedlerella sp.]|nr:Jag N-terminal domain-containing protein [Schaedlerella sp.]